MLLFKSSLNFGCLLKSDELVYHIYATSELQAFTYVLLFIIIQPIYCIILRNPRKSIEKLTKTSLALL